jgi:hypothetical protein
VSGLVFCGLLCVLVGGYIHIDPCGAVLLFLIGGVVGLVVNMIYKKGRDDAGGGPDRPSDPNI